MVTFNNTEKKKALKEENQNLLVKVVQVFVDRVENMVEKGENADKLHFFPFPKVFSKAFFHLVILSKDSLNDKPTEKKAISNLLFCKNNVFI